MALETLEQLKTRIQAAFPQATIDILPNSSVPGESSLVLGAGDALAIAQFLRDDPQLRFDYASNVTGVDWPDKIVKEKKREKRTIYGVEREIEHTIEKKIPGFLEVVYHLYSMELKHGPLIVRLRTRDRSEGVHVPSLTPVWRSAELQEREVFDLFGVVFDGHPDLRRILMWEGFEDHPMRKDYVDPDDFEYEPTAHDAVLERAKEHYSRGEPL